MLEIYFIRHGESVGNFENRFRGRHDFPLNENGIEQAYALREELKNESLEVIYSSPLQRALKTAQIIANKKIPVNILEAFTNISLGTWEKKAKSEIKEKFPDLWNLWINNPEKLYFPGMESLSEVQSRSFKALRNLIQKHKSGCIAVVSHRAVFKPLFAVILNISEPYFWKIHLDTAAYAIVEYHVDRGFTVTCLNQNKHLERYIREDLG